MSEQLEITASTYLDRILEILPSWGSATEYKAALAAKLAVVCDDAERRALASVEPILRMIWNTTEDNAEHGLRDAHRAIARLTGWKR